MRIIDKNTDFYDYIQNIYKDNHITFDRQDSFVVTKKMMCSYLYNYIRHDWSRRYDSDSQVGRKAFLLLQICNKFYLFLLTVMEEEKDFCFRTPISYTVEFLDSWENFNKERKLISLDLIKFNLDITNYFLSFEYWKNKFSYNEDWIRNNVKTLEQAIDTNNFLLVSSINNCVIKKADGTTAEKHIPLLKGSGLIQYLDPLDVFLKIEEYFSMEKTETERTESIGITDKEKIENHGFDNKISFRGKV